MAFIKQWTAPDGTTYDIKAKELTSFVANGSDNLSCLQNIFSTVPKSEFSAVRLQHGSHSMALGWFLSGYDYDHAYGGWFISDYGTPVWVGVDNGTWNTANFLTSNNYTSYTVTKTGGGASGTWGINISGNASSASYADTVDGYHASSLWRSDGATWNGGANVICSGTGTEWSFDVSETGSGDSFWHVWSGNLGNTMIGCYPKDGHVTIPYWLDCTRTGNHGLLVGTIRGKAVGSQSGEYIHMYERVHIGSPSGWGSRSAPTYGLSTYGGCWLATDTGSVGIGTTSPARKLHVSGDWIRIDSSGLYLEIGCMNSSYCHLQTNAPQFYVNKKLIVDGDIARYTGTGTISGYNLNGNATSATKASYLSNVSHSVTLNVSSWGASNPWGASNFTRVWGQQGYWSAKSSDTADMDLFYGNTSASGGAGWFLCIDGGIYSLNGIYSAVWNDYAEYRQANSIEPGRCIIEKGDDTLILSTKRLQPGAEIISDTFGFAIGKTDECQTPIAAAGRVLAYPTEDRYSYKVGQPVCSGPDGTVSQMTDEEMRLYPNCIIGYVSAIPEYEEWGTGKVKVNGRIWIRIR